MRTLRCFQYRRQLFIPWIGVAVVMVIKEIIYVMFYLYAWIDGSKYGVSISDRLISLLARDWYVNRVISKV